jgi:ribosomal protein S18 acetylase RimI-like enzyme
MSNYRILDPTLEDAAAIGAMHLQSWIETYQNPKLGIDEAWIRKNVGYVSEESGTNFRRQIITEIESGERPQFYKIVKDEAGQIVGFGHAKREKDGSPRIDALYVLKSAQGTGLGSELMDQMLAWTGEGQPVDLQVVSYNDHAIEFYKKRGFKVVEGSEEKWKDGVTVIRMIKK